MIVSRQPQPTIVEVKTTELHQTISAKPPDVNNVINVAPPESQVVIQKDSRPWRFTVHRDEMGRITAMDATPN